MYGLTIRWSLMDAPPGTAEVLRDYVLTESQPHFSGMPGLHQKTWQMAERGYFSGVYIWATAEARSGFLETFRANPSKVSQLVGHGPDVLQEWELLAVAVGAEGPLTP